MAVGRCPMHPALERDGWAAADGEREERASTRRLGGWRALGLPSVIARHVVVIFACDSRPLLGLLLARRRGGPLALLAGGALGAGRAWRRGRLSSGAGAAGGRAGGCSLRLVLLHRLVLGVGGRRLSLAAGGLLRLARACAAGERVGQVVGRLDRLELPGGVGHARGVGHDAGSLERLLELELASGAVDEPGRPPDAVEDPASRHERPLLAERLGPLGERGGRTPVEADAQSPVVRVVLDHGRRAGHHAVKGEGVAPAVQPGAQLAVGGGLVEAGGRHPQRHLRLLRLRRPQRVGARLAGGRAGEGLDGPQLEVVRVGHVGWPERPEEDHAVAGARKGHVVLLLVDAGNLWRRLALGGHHREEDDVALVALEGCGVADHHTVPCQLRVGQLLEQQRAQQPSLLDAGQRDDADRRVGQFRWRPRQLGRQVVDQRPRLLYVGLAALGRVWHEHVDQRRLEPARAHRQPARQQPAVVEVVVAEGDAGRHAPEVLEQRDASVGEAGLRQVEDGPLGQQLLDVRVAGAEQPGLEVADAGLGDEGGGGRHLLVVADHQHACAAQ
eukprot:scaffold4358_cov137-Isochrysis_galbana.AAC.14